MNFKEYIDSVLNEEESNVKYGVFRVGGNVGSNNDKPVKIFASKEEAKEYAKRLRKQLSPGEKSYYRMSYIVKPIKE